MMIDVENNPAAIHITLFIYGDAGLGISRGHHPQQNGGEPLVWRNVRPRAETDSLFHRSSLLVSRLNLQRLTVRTEFLQRGINTTPKFG